MGLLNVRHKLRELENLRGGNLWSCILDLKRKHGRSNCRIRIPGKTDYLSYLCCENFDKIQQTDNGNAVAPANRKGCQATNWILCVCVSFLLWLSTSISVT